MLSLSDHKVLSIVNRVSPTVPASGVMVDVPGTGFLFMSTTMYDIPSAPFANLTLHRSLYFDIIS